MSKKRGFSIVEVVIALTVMVIVTFASLSVVSSSIAKRVGTANETKAQQFASDVLESFKASSDLQEFKQNVYFSLGESEEENGWNDWKLDIENESIGFYTYEKEGVFKAKVRIDGGARSKITVVVMKSKVSFTDFYSVIKIDPETNVITLNEDEDNLIISFTYEKGGA